VSLEAVRIVLVRPADPLNVGAVARAMKNCELSDLVLVAPATTDWVTARRVAVHAEELLEDPVVVPTLREAVADAGWVVGTSSRVAGALTPRQVGVQTVERVRSGTRVALVFGGEESGLSNADLLGCHACSCIPSGAAQPSFNLGQAVLLYAYETFVAHAAASGRPAPARADGAEDRELDAVEHVIRDFLGAIGFADPDRPRHGVRDLAHTLRRAGLVRREARLWQAVLRAGIRAAEKAGR
jgi:tRNA/rRNA methyltransferase